MLRQTQRSHVVAPPHAPAREEDRVLIRPVGDSIHDAHFSLFIVFQFLVRHQI
jgi:hypothetical protein